MLPPSGPIDLARCIQLFSKNPLDYQEDIAFTANAISGTLLYDVDYEAYRMFIKLSVPGTNFSDHCYMVNYIVGYKDGNGNPVSQKTTGYIQVYNQVGHENVFGELMIRTSNIPQEYVLDYLRLTFLDNHAHVIENTPVLIYSLSELQLAS